MAVYTVLDRQDIDDIVRQYDVGEVVSFEGISEGVENTNYLVETEKAKFILTIYEKRVRKEDIPFYLNYMLFLAKEGIDCPCPIATKEGALSVAVGEKVAALISFLDGKAIAPSQINTDYLHSLGQALAAMHLASAKWTESAPDNYYSIASWKDLFAGVDADQADSVKKGLYQEITECLGRVDATWPGQLPKGVIHGDLFPDNVFFQQKQCSGIIDFYFACTDFYMYDLAICLNAWCFESDMSFNITKARSFLQGYQQKRDISEEELNALPMLAEGAALRFLLTRLYDWFHIADDAEVVKKDPLEYLHKLRFHHNVESYGAYGIE